MNIKYLFFVIIIIIFGSCKQTNINSNSLNNNKDSVSYSIGVNLGHKLKNEGVKDINPELLKLALQQVLEDDSTLINYNEAMIVLQNYFTNIKKEKNKLNLENAENFLKKNKKNSDVIETASGLQYKIIKNGSGNIPTLDDLITVHYKLKTIEGKILEDTYMGNPVVFSVNKVIAGLQEILTIMQEGSIYELYIPPKLAYGAAGSGEKIEANSLLIYEMELIKINTQTN